MGRLFWKFLLAIWLAEVVGMAMAGVFFRLEHERFDRLHGAPPFEERGPVRPHRSPDWAGGPPPPHAGKPPDGPKIPWAHLAGGMLAGLCCAAGLAWYFSKPIRHLRRAFAAGERGDLEVKVASSMGRRRDELADLGHDFDRMSARLRALMSGQRRLLHDVSHELRSPLARLNAAVGLARQQPDRLDDSMGRIEREAERINTLVGELLTLSRLEAGVGVVTEEIDLAELLGDLIEDARFEAASRAVTVDFLCGENFMVRVQPEWLYRAIENVVRNALRFSPVGAQVQVKLDAAEEGVCRLRVLDEGPGVPAEACEAIFSPFYRASSQGEGYGLGLAIARRALLSVGGDICAENRPEGGLCVELRIPGVPLARALG